MTVAAVFFDVDGTLVTGTNSGEYLASFLGHEDLVAAAYADWDAGLIDSASVELADAKGWAGATRDEVREWLTGLPLVDGISDVLDWCSRHHVLAALATMAWEPVGSYLCEVYGFAATCGPRLEYADGHFTGAVARHCSEVAKRDYALEFARSAGLSMDSCAAIGDSRSDVPLFRAANLAVAFNGDAHVQELADVHVYGNDLRDVLPALEVWLSGLGRSGDQGRRRCSASLSES
ncbi:MAG TPA: HAD-IB family phosphatase [Streptosporangiaceae bacterium]